MVIATATASGLPAARVVLCRGIDALGVVFFTNYESQKGRELTENPHAAAVFFWPSLGRQARLEGAVEELSAAESDAYFAKRPRGHQLQAWASHQSQVIGSLEEVRARHAALEKEYTGRDVPRPPYWGGYRLVAAKVELWINGADRLHSREVFHREAEGWRSERLSP